MNEHRDYWPRTYAIAEPAKDGATWPCGHPRTEANTQRVGNTNGPRCRICRRKINRDSRRRQVAAAR